MSKIRYLALGAVLVLEIAACGSSPAQEPQAPEPAAPVSSTEQPAAPPATPSALPATTATAAASPDLALPEALKGKAVALASTDPDYARAKLAEAVKPAGEGGLTRGLVVRLTADIPVWRMWSGPAKKYNGNTNRLGQWWSYDAPHGTQQDYRQAYEICASWNDLTWVAKCTLKSGAVVAIGPGNSVSAATCGGATGKEAYPANDKDWQVYIAEAWKRLGADKELDCPAESADYEADAADISKKRAAPGAVGKKK